MQLSSKYFQTVSGSALLDLLIMIVQVIFRIQIIIIIIIDYYNRQNYAFNAYAMALLG